LQFAEVFPDEQIVATLMRQLSCNKTLKEKIDFIF